MAISFERFSFGETKEELIMKLKKEVRGLKSGLTVFNLEEKLDEKEKEIRKYIKIATDTVDEYKKLAKENTKETEVAQKRLEEEFETKTFKLESETEAKRANVIAEIREASQVKVDELKVSEADATARYEEYGDVVDEVKAQNNQLQSVIDALLKKLPNVDLSKLSVNLEAPATTVNVKK